MGVERLTRVSRGIPSEAPRSGASRGTQPVSWSVYLLQCENGKVYTGVTNQLARRISEHRTGRGGRFTAAAGYGEALYVERFTSKMEAVSREAQLKTWSRRKKLALAQSNLAALKRA